jgi:hypothetical protein
MKHLFKLFLVITIYLFGCENNKLKEDEYFDLITGFDYDFIYSSKNNPFFRIENKNSRNIIDENGNTLLPNWYYEIIPFENSENFLFARKSKDEKKYSIIDKKGNQITDFIFTDVFPFGDSGLAAVQKYDNGKYGAVDTTGKIVIEFIYDQSFYFNKNIAKVIYNGVPKTININNQYVDQLPYKTAPLKGLKQFSFYSLDGVKYGILNREDEIVCEPKFKMELYNSFNDFGYSIIQLENGTGIIDTTGKLIGESDHQFVAVYEDQLAVITKDYNSFSLANFKGEAVFNLKMDYCNPELHTSKKLLIVSKNKKLGMIDMSGNIVVDFKYSLIQALGNDYFSIGKENKFALAKIKSDLIPIDKLQTIHYTK